MVHRAIQIIFFDFCINRLSFPSGHASLAVYSMCYLVVSIIPRFACACNWSFS